MNHPHPIAAAALAVLEEIGTLAAIGLFIAAAMVWAGIIGGPL